MQFVYLPQKFTIHCISFKTIWSVTFNESPGDIKQLEKCTELKLNWRVTNGGYFPCLLSATNSRWPACEWRQWGQFGWIEHAVLCIFFFMATGHVRSIWSKSRPSQFFTWTKFMSVVSISDSGSESDTTGDTFCCLDLDFYKSTTRNSPTFLVVVHFSVEKS